ncbi:hypothetical protein [Streptomyces sp. NPDC060027]
MAGVEQEMAPPQDYWHCPACRTDVRQYPTLRATLSGRRQRGR